MLCSSCGKDIPLTGQICPYCKADKSIDKRRYTLGFIGATIGVVTSLILSMILHWFVGGGLSLMTIAILVGGGLGAFVGQVYGYVTLPSPTKSDPIESDTYPCPYCAETIKKAAKICRFCGYDVTPTAANAPHTSSLPSVMPTPAPESETLHLRNDR